MKPHVQPFFHEASNTWSYVVADPDGRAAAVIDPVLDFDAKSGRIATTSAQALVDHVRAHGLGQIGLLALQLCRISGAHPLVHVPAASGDAGHLEADSRAGDLGDLPERARAWAEHLVCDLPVGHGEAAPAKIPASTSAVTSVTHRIERMSSRGRVTSDIGSGDK